MKFALTGYIVSMAKIVYVHVMRRDYFAMIIEIASLARILYVHVIGGITRSPKYLAWFVGVSSSSGFCIFNLLIHIFFWFSDLRFQYSKFCLVCCCIVASSYPCFLSFIFSFAFIFSRDN